MPGSRRKTGKNYSAMLGKKKKSTPPAKLSAPVRRAVTTMIKRSKETKSVSCGSNSPGPWGQSSPYGFTFNSPITSTTEFYPLNPPLPQGTGEAERLGDKVNPTGLSVRFMVTAQGGYTSNMLNRIRLFIVSQKNIKSISLQGSLEPTLLLEQSGVAQAYDGTPAAHLIPVNKESFIVHHDKRLTLSKGYGRTPVLGNAYDGDAVFIGNQQTYEFVLKVKLPKTLTFDEDTTLYPSNSAIWFALGYCQPDGQSTPDVTNQRVQVNWLSTMYYKDA